MIQVNLANYLVLERPLACLDLETTGFDPDVDRIVQISVTIHYPHREPIHWDTLVDPECKIQNASESHGITNEMVAGKPTFRQVAPALAPKLLNVDITGYNPDFDVKFMRAEMKRAVVPWPWDGHLIDPYQIFRKKKPHNLTNAYVEYGGEDGEPLPSGSTLDGAHDASVDTMASDIVLRGMLLRYKDLPKTPKELEAYCFPNKARSIDPDGKFVWDDRGTPCIAFGKYSRGGPYPMHLVEPNYWKFITDNNFSADCKKLAADAMRGIFPVRAV